MSEVVQYLMADALEPLTCGEISGGCEGCCGVARGNCRGGAVGFLNKFSKTFSPSYFVSGTYLP